MSMISGQVDRLRTAAQTYRRLGNHSAESMLLDAADTIWQLRDDLQRTNDAVRDAEHDESMAWDRVRKAEAENAKLRELCAGLLAGYECGYGELCKGCTWDGLGDSKTFSCLPRAKARDLGVEVDA